MSTATLERVALPEAMDIDTARDGSRSYNTTLTRGATEWRILMGFSAGPLGERLILDGQPFHRPAVHIYKGVRHYSGFTALQDAPRYVQKFVEDHMWTVAEYEQNLHGVPPMTMAECRAAEAAEDAHKRAVEAAAAARHAAKVQATAKAIRSAAQCGTVNSEIIAAWCLKHFVERHVHDDKVAEFEDERAEHRELLAEIAAERKEEHSDIIGELNDAIDIAQRADEAIQAMATAANALGAPNATEFAHGSTESGKLLDVLSDGLWAIDKYQSNYSNSDLPEKREIK